jgi:hypothetical protein
MFWSRMEVMGRILPIRSAGRQLEVTICDFKFLGRIPTVVFHPLQ